MGGRLSSVLDFPIQAAFPPNSSTRPGLGKTPTMGEHGQDHLQSQVCAPHPSEMPHRPSFLSAPQELLLGRKRICPPGVDATFPQGCVERSQDLLSHRLHSPSSLVLIPPPPLLSQLGGPLTPHPPHCTFISHSPETRENLGAPLPASCHGQRWVQSVIGHSGLVTPVLPSS